MLTQIHVQSVFSLWCKIVETYRMRELICGLSWMRNSSQNKNMFISQKLCNLKLFGMTH